ncbi:hypothetical protein WJX74_003170 [Apatococcus lobatus]|uniref:PWWP domain-containing protein n=1 Tax=Apatococcus lobatus TaxID=904363 RepID=A0AAW1QCQ4_9CHLO
MPGVKRRVGDLVWAVVRGYPNWPGQVMDPKTAPARVLDSKKAGDTILVSFFADSSYGWFPDINLHEFEARYEDYKNQKANKSAKNFSQAVAEAKEVLDKRAGRKPATNLEPIDFLDETAEIEDEHVPQQQEHAWMRRPTDEDWQSLLPASCLAWLRAAATVSTSMVSMEPEPNIEEHKQMLFAWDQRRRSGPKSKGSRKGGKLLKNLKRAAEEEPQDEVHEKKRKKRKSITSADGLVEEGPEEAADAADALPGPDSEEKPVKKTPGRRAVQKAQAGFDQPLESPEAKVASSDPISKEAGQEWRDDADPDISAAEDDDAGGAGAAGTEATQEDSEEESEEDEEEGGAARRLLADLEQIPGLLRTMAAQSLRVHTSPLVLTSEHAAFLLFRELVYSRSRLHMSDVVGKITQDTFAAPGICWQDDPSRDESGDAAGDVAGGEADADDADSDAVAMPTPMLSKKKRKRRATPSSDPLKRKKWSPAQRDPGEPDLTKSRFRAYLNRLPSETSKIWDDLHRFHAAERSKMNVPMLEHQPLDMPFIFKEVAKRGGYAAVTVNRQWKQVAKTWRSELAKVPCVSHSLRKHYLQHLLGYEDKVAAGAPTNDLPAAKSYLRISRTAEGAEFLSPATMSSSPDSQAKAKRRAAGAEAAAEAALEGEDDVDDDEDDDGDDLRTKTSVRGELSDDSDGDQMRGTARASGPKKYQKEKDLRGLALAKQNARFRRKQSKQSPPPEDKASAPAPGSAASGARGVDPRMSSMPLTGSRYGMASGRDASAPTLPRRVVKHERHFSSLHSGEQLASAVDTGSGDFDDGVERAYQPLQASRMLPRESNAQEGYAPESSALSPDHIPYAQRPVPPKCMVVLRVNRDVPLPSRAVIKVNLRAFGALGDKDIILSHKHNAIALRYTSETHARAAFRACQERASNWFNIAKNAIRVSLEEEKPPVRPKMERPPEPPRADGKRTNASRRSKLKAAQGSSLWQGNLFDPTTDLSFVGQPGGPVRTSAGNSSGVPMDPRKARATGQQPQPAYQQPQQQPQPQMAPQQMQQLPQQLPQQPQLAPQANFQGWQQPQHQFGGQQLQQQLPMQQSQPYAPYGGPMGQMGSQWQQPQQLPHHLPHQSLPPPPPQQLQQPTNQQPSTQQAAQQQQQQPAEAASHPEAEMAALDLMAILRNAGVNLDPSGAAASGSENQNSTPRADASQQPQQVTADAAAAAKAPAAESGGTTEASANISDQLMSLVGMLSTGAVNGS